MWGSGVNGPRAILSLLALHLKVGICLRGNRICCGVGKTDVCLRVSEKGGRHLWA